ncbi:hypothetical protein D3C75_1125580 [compost metagenome]
MLVEQTGFVCADEHSFTAEYFNFVAFHQAGYAGGHSFNHAVFEFLRFRPVHFDVLGSYPENFTVLCSFILMCC